MEEAGTAVSHYAAEPAVIVIADTPAGAERFGRAAAAVGARVVARTSPDEAPERLERQIRLDAALVDIAGGEPLERIAGTLEAAARAGRWRSVVEVPIELLDAADARFGDCGIELLCAAGELERAAAVGLATAARPLELHDARGEAGDPRLLRLSEEIGRIARALAELSEAPAAGPLAGAAARANGAAPEAPAPTAADFRAMLRIRRLRDRFFDETLFADPAWDMLLDLMAARLERRQVAVSSLCIAAAVPPTTALRWIKAMTDRGLFVRRADPKDRRRVFIELADRSAAAMERWFAEIRAGGAATAT